MRSYGGAGKRYLASGAVEAPKGRSGEAKPRGRREGFSALLALFEATFPLAASKGKKDV